jgi:DNA-binding transcriptional ArsR family regulator
MAPPRRLEGDIRLDDPGALRVLAHPARMAVVEELYQGVERTASELGELVGLSPSAMSYHLRALERWGVVERAAPREDARERPWRAAGRTLRLTSDAASPAALAAADVIAGASLQRLRDDFRRWALAEPRESEAWREASGMNRTFLWLTEDEVRALSADLKAVLERHLAGRDAAHHPEGTRRVFCMVAIVPEPG